MEPSDQGGIASLFNSTRLSDVVIRCGEREWPAHKTILCTQSSFFSKACEGSFKEAGEGVVTLQDESPDVVHAILHFLYTGDYSPPSVGEGSSPLAFHLRMFAAAELYFIDNLKDKTATKFDDVTAVGSSFTQQQFTDALLAYAAVVTDHENSLRKSLVKAIVKYSHSFLGPSGGEKFKKAFAEVPGIAADVADDLYLRYTEGRDYYLYKCPMGCSQVIRMKKPLVEYYECDKCFRGRWHMTVASWEDYRMQVRTP